MGPPYFSRLANDFVPCHLNPSVYLSSVSIYHCTSVLVIPRLLLLHVGHVLVLGRGPRGLDVTRRLVILDIDCARVTHPNRVTRLLTRNVLKYTAFVIISSHLAESEDDVLVVLADVIHAGVVPGSDVLLGDVTVRRVTLVITLMEKGFNLNSPFYALVTRIFLTDPLTDTVFIRGHNEDGDEDDSEESNQSSEDSEAD